MFASFLRDRRGSVALIFGLAVIPLVLGVGIAVDYSRAASVHDHLQDLADTAALAAARAPSGDPAEAARVARAYFDAHLPPHSLASVDDFRVTITQDGAVRVEVDGEVETTFTAVAGIDRMAVSVASEVMRGVEGSLEVAFVLDNTGSMRGRKLASLKKVATKLIEDIEANENIDARFGLVPFSEYVNVGKSHAGAAWLDMPRGRRGWDGCVGSRDYPLNVRDQDYGTRVPALSGVTCGAEIQPLTDDTHALKRAISSMTADNLTYIPAGLVWGWRLLSRVQPFTEGEAYDAENRKPRKVIVLLTDGANTLRPDLPRHVRDVRRTDVSQSDAYVGEICVNAKAANIEIFTIAFEVDEPGIKDILRGCASDPSRYFDAGDSEALEVAFAQMTSSFLDLRITR